MSTQADLDLAAHKVVTDERVKEQKRIQRLLLRPEMGSLVGAIAIFIFFCIVAAPFRTPEALATVLYSSSTIGIMACAVALLIDRRRVRPSPPASQSPRPRSPRP